jgi:capsular exopolysaccharide synthesis family protein
MLPSEPNRPASVHSIKPVSEYAPPSSLALPPAPAAGLGAPPPVQATDGGFALVEALRHRWPRALLFGLLAAVLAVGVTLLVYPPRYQAQLLIHIATHTPKDIFGTESSYESNEEFTNYVRTQTTLVKSRPVLQAALRQPKIAELSEVRAQADPVAWLDKALQVDTLQGPEVMRVTLSGERPEEVAALLNAIADAYLKDVVQKEQVDRQEQKEQLNKSLHDYEAALRTKRDTLHELQDRLGVDDPDTVKARYAAAQTQENTVRTELLKKRLELTTAEEELKALKNSTEKPTQSYVSKLAVDEFLMRQDPVATKYFQRLAEIDTAIQQVRSVATPASQRHFLEGLEAQRKDILAVLEARRNEVRPLVQTQLRTKPGEDPVARLEWTIPSIKEQIKTLDAELARQETVVKRLATSTRTPDKPMTELEELRNDILQTESFEKKVSDRLETLKVEARPRSRVSVMESAEAPRSRNFQPQIKVGGLAGFAAFAVIGLVVTWPEVRARRIHATEDVLGLGVNLVGALPALPPKARRLLPTTSNRREAYWQSLMAESVDAIRTLLLHAAQTESLQIVLVTSATGGEGKTSLASHLATSLARAWRKTLLIDGDLRNPGAHKQFDLPLEPGFSELLRGEAEIEDVVRPTAASRLWLVPAGQWDAHAVQALAQREVRHLFARLKEQYDFIIIDSSPVLPVADTLSLGQHVDGVIFSVLRDVSRLPAVQAAYNRLNALGIRMLGTVVVGAPNDVGGLPYQYPLTSKG